MAEHLIFLPPRSPLEERQSEKRNAAVLSDIEIEYQMSIGNIVIWPYHPDQLQSSSYDLRLGEYFYREHTPEPGETLYSPWSESDVRRVWGEPEQATLASEKFLTKGQPLPGGIFADDQVILMPPKSRILGHTIEFIGGRSEVTTSMQARSSMGRNAITVCECAGWGDVGYINRWTMEITNNFTEQTVILVVGRRIAQMIFQRTGPTRQNYAEGGKYQLEKELSKLIDNWKPDDMLPKMWKDREIQPGYEKPDSIVIKREPTFSEILIQLYGDMFPDDTWLIVEKDSMQILGVNEDPSEISIQSGVPRDQLRYIHIGYAKRYLKAS
jgi:dCTP deaminase